MFASLLLCVAYIWGAVASSFESLLWSNVVAAFAGSSTEALGAAMVNDLYFLHERGWYVTRCCFFLGFWDGQLTKG